MHLDRRDIGIGLSLFAISVLLFGPTSWNGFSNWDDPQYVSENRHVLSGLSAANAAWAFSTFQLSNWNPLTWLSFQLDAQIFGSAPAGFHLTNVVFHALNAILLFWTLRQMTGAVWRSGFVALLFAVHPLRVESVAWIAERKDVLSTFFWLTTCMSYGWYTSRPSWLRYTATLVSFALGLMAKPMLVTLPFVLLLLDYWPLQRLGWTTPTKSLEHPVPQSRLRTTWVLFEKVPFLLLAAGSSVMTYYGQLQTHAGGSGDRHPVVVRLANAILNYGAYLGQTLWPMNLGAFYPYPTYLSDSTGIVSITVIGAFLIVTAVTVFVLVKGRSLPYLPVGWFWYLITLGPVIGLVEFGGTTRADRFTYVPHIGLFLAVVWGVADLAQVWRLHKLVIAAGAVFCLFFVGLTWRQLQYWRSDVSLWEHTLQACGESTAAHIKLGDAFRSAEDLQRAATEYRKALRLDPDDPFAYLGLGTSLVSQGRIPDAVAEFRQGVHRNPGSSMLHYHLALALVDIGRRQDAVLEHQEALRLNPRWTPGHKSLGLLLYAEGRLDEALPHLEAAVDGGAADHSVYYALGRILAMQGQWEPSTRAFTEAVALQPRNWRYHAFLGFALDKAGRAEPAQEQYRHTAQLNPLWAENLNAEGWVLAADPNATKRNGRAAVQVTLLLCQATANREPRFLDTLAAAQAEIGQFDPAVKTAEKAVAAASSLGQASLAEEIRSRSRLYEKHQPFRKTAEPAPQTPRPR
jgi:tetratricopeptide (TPR) repeat protein